MTCGAWRTDRPRGYDHRRTGPGVHQRGRRAGGRKAVRPSTPDPLIYPMAQIHRRASLQLHPSLTPGRAPLGTRPHEQHWNQIIARLGLSTGARYTIAVYRNRKPNMAVLWPEDQGWFHRCRRPILYSSVSEICRSRVRYGPDSAPASSADLSQTTPHTPVLPRHNWRTMHC